MCAPVSLGREETCVRTERTRGRIEMSKEPKTHQRLLSAPLTRHCRSNRYTRIIEKRLSPVGSAQIPFLIGTICTGCQGLTIQTLTHKVLRICTCKPCLNKVSDPSRIKGRDCRETRAESERRKKNLIATTPKLKSAANASKQKTSQKLIATKTSTSASPLFRQRVGEPFARRLRTLQTTVQL